jgi:hypothetical protein
MSERREIEEAIYRYIEGVNTDNVNIIPLAGDVVLCGPMIPEPIRGESAVRQYLGETSPFIARMELKMTVIEDDNAAIVFEFEGLNGVVVEGVYVFRFEGGLIRHGQVFFDTRLLMKGAK